MLHRSYDDGSGTLMTVVGRPMGWFLQASTRFPARTCVWSTCFSGPASLPGPGKKHRSPIPFVGRFAQSSFSSRRHQLRRRPALFRLASRRPTASSPPQESHSSVPHLPRHLVPPPDRDGPNLRRSSCARAHALRLAVGLLSGVPPAADRFDLPPQYATACPLLPSKKKRRFAACFSSGSRKIDPRVLT